ncbi:MAG TPA: polyphosphate kinase 1, partial [candidate division Zixibacteria bacterium]|nr:polyphosphate kinase 1 [candidate division Zixibacteria bacterium]
MADSLTPRAYTAKDNGGKTEEVERLYRSKELSWLSFNHRVLQEAADPTVPLLERLRFLGIFSSNLDEFFRVRVATLQRLLQLGKKAVKLIGESPRQILNEIQEIVLDQHREFDALYQDLTSELASRNVFIVSERELDQPHGDYVRHFFRQTVRPHLMPLMISQIADLPRLRDQSTYLAIRLARSKAESQKESALIEVPTNRCSRFVILPPYNHQQYVMLLDDVIR